MVDEYYSVSYLRRLSLIRYKWLCFTFFHPVFKIHVNIILPLPFSSFQVFSMHFFSTSLTLRFSHHHTLIWSSQIQVFLHFSLRYPFDCHFTPAFRSIIRSPSTKNDTNLLFQQFQHITKWLSDEPKRKWVWHSVIYPNCLRVSHKISH